MIVHDLATAFDTVITAATAWVEALAGASAFILCVAAFVAFGARPTTPYIVRRAMPRPSWARSPLRARALARRTRTLPLWAHTQPHDYDEAA
ncbi:hypothetical protein ACFYOF_16825 [Streptomyces sp. NPDC007148]|uniref:hypothetical protein n=1 Tax=Streptomyces sp. NPDC007148 TaxID=3364775 RepID=UPI0036AB6017